MRIAMLKCMPEVFFLVLKSKAVVHRKRQLYLVCGCHKVDDVVWTVWYEQARISSVSG